MMYSHIPVMLDEIIEYLNPKPGNNFVDCTLGGGGHTLEILKRVAPNGKVLGIDLDEKALKFVKLKVHKIKSCRNEALPSSKDKEKDGRMILAQDNFSNLKNILDENKFYPVNGILLDLGISSAEYENGGGFSFQKDELLDMRFGGTSPLPHPQKKGDILTAEIIVNNWSKEKLMQIFREYGEELLAFKIADRIVKIREEKRIKTTKQLADLIFSEYKKTYKNKTFKKHPATKVFQALRIAVNDELGNLEKVLPQALSALEKGGMLAIISFHSLEDRIVKRFFASQAKGCFCPSEFPICKCGHKPLLKIITKKPIIPSDNEIEKNPRARSAKLRVAEKIS